MPADPKLGRSIWSTVKKVRRETLLALFETLSLKNFQVELRRTMPLKMHGGRKEVEHKYGV